MARRAWGGDAGSVVWRGGVGESGEDKAVKGESSGKDRGNDGVDRGPVSDVGWAGNVGHADDANI